MNHLKVKWISVTEYVDLETGELITKSLYEREYYKVRTTKKIEHGEKYNIQRYTTECRRTGQTKIEI